MASLEPRPRRQDDRRETAGFLVSLVFVLLAAVRDVYLGGLFQRANPLHVAVVAFTLCTLSMVPIALVHSRASLVYLVRYPRDLFWVNVSSAVAWLAFFAALRLIEPTLVQILYSGIGPLSVIWIDRYARHASTGAALTRLERAVYAGLFASLVCSAGVALLGLSGAGVQPLGVAALGVAAAVGGGISISVSTTLCRRLNEAGASPAAVLALRYPATALAGAALALMVSPRASPGSPLGIDISVLIAAAIIIVPSYVNQVGISLASPLTVRVVLATGPVLIFGVQLLEGRLSVSPYSLVAAIAYAVAAILAGVARHRAIRSAAG